MDTSPLYNMDTSPLYTPLYTSVYSMNHFTVQVWYMKVHGLAEDHQADWPDWALQLAQDGCTGYLLLQMEHLVVSAWCGGVIPLSRQYFNYS